MCDCRGVRFVGVRVDGIDCPPACWYRDACVDWLVLGTW